MPIARSKIARSDCHRGVCNKIMMVDIARYPFLIGCSLSLTLSSISHIRQDDNRKGKSPTCKRGLFKHKMIKLEKNWRLLFINMSLYILGTMLKTIWYKELEQNYKDYLHILLT